MVGMPEDFQIILQPGAHEQRDRRQQHGGHDQVSRQCGVVVGHVLLCKRQEIHQHVGEKELDCGVADHNEQGGEFPHEVHPRDPGIEGCDARDGCQHKQIVVQVAVRRLAHVQPDAQRIAQGKDERKRRQPRIGPALALCKCFLPKGNRQEHGTGNQL